MKRIGLAILGLSASLLAQENPAFWSKYKVISVNTKASGANVASTVSKFPVLVRLNATNANDVFTEARPGGADIRFGNAAGTAFRPYQIESWDATAKTAAIWVQADSIKGNDSVATLRIYWGRANYSTTSNGAAVFDTAADWRVVYHMNGGTAATEQDATAHGFTMIASDTIPAAIPGDTLGVVGKARMFKGDSTTVAGRQFFVAPNTAGSPALNIGANNPHTISSWVFARAINPVGGSGNSIFNKGDQQYALQIYGNAGATGVKQWEAAVYTSTWRQAKSKGPAVAGAWTHVTGTWSGGANGTNGIGKFYINGVLDSTTINLGIGNVSPQQAYNLFIGANPNGGGTNVAAPGDNRTMSRLNTTLQRPRFWDGYIDDITLARGVRSDDYVKLTYETQKPAATAVVLGATQTQTAPTATAITNIYYVMPGAGNAPRDTMNFAFNAPVNLTLKFDGGPADSVAITTGTLPAGLTVDKYSGRLSGTTAAAYPAANLTLTVYASTGNVTRGLRISVASGAMVLQKYTQDTATYATGIAVSNAPVFSANGRAATKVKITPALPAGLKIDTVTGVISGTPTTAAAAANYTVTAYNSTDSSSRVVRFTVVDISTENYATGWSVHKDIWLNTQGNGASTTTGVGKFPVLVRLDAAFIGTGTQPLANGADIRFTKDGDLVRLPYEIESWNATTKTGAVWVRVDSIAPNTKQKFRMHWGNATAPSLSSGPSVFDTAAGFQAVWHLNGTANEADATVNGFTAVAANAPTSGTGIIGPARVFNGTNQYFSVPNTASGVLNFQQTQSYTLSSWINPTAISTAANTGHKIIDKGDNQYVLATYGPDEATRYWEITIKGNGAWNQCQADGSFAGSAAVLASSSVNSWNHLVGTYTGGAVGTEVTQRLYYNGKLVNQCVIQNTDASGRTETFNVHLGVQAAGTAPGSTFSRYWQGSLDEPRLANKARSLDWVKLEYHNQKTTVGNNLVSFTEPVSIGAMASMARQGLFFKAMNNGVQFTVGGLAAGEKATLSLVDAWGRTVFSGAFEGNSLNWNGRANNGHEMSAGVYVARVKILSADGRANRVLEHRVPFTR